MCAASNVTHENVSLIKHFFKKTLTSKQALVIGNFVWKCVLNIYENGSNSLGKNKVDAEKKKNSKRNGKKKKRKKEKKQEEEASIVYSCYCNTPETGIVF